jgi:hypothetical protein
MAGVALVQADTVPVGSISTWPAAAVILGDAAAAVSGSDWLAFGLAGLNVIQTIALAYIAVRWRNDRR